MANTELVGGNVQIGDGYVVIATRRPSIACDPDIVESLESRGNRIGSHAWSVDHLTRFHGITAEEIERDILQARCPGSALGERHYDDHNNGAASRLPIAHAHIGEHPDDVEALEVLRDALRALGCERWDGPGGLALVLVSRLLSIVGAEA